MIKPPLGVVLAGGQARRLPGKPLLELRGRPLISYPLAALGAVLEDVVVVAKRPIAGLQTSIEPPEPVHPLCGIRHALELAAGRAVLVCAADMPQVDAAELRAVLAARKAGACAVVPRAGGRLQPLCALYEAVALEPLRRAGADEPMARIVECLGPHVIERAPGPYANINTPAQLAERE